MLSKTFTLQHTNNKMEKIQELLQGIMPHIDFETERNLIDDGILDSLDIVSIISELTSEFDIEIPTEEITPENFNSLQSISTMVDRLMEED